MLNRPPKMVTCDKCGFTRKIYWRFLEFTRNMDSVYKLETDNGCPRCAGVAQW